MRRVTEKNIEGLVEVINANSSVNGLRVEFSSGRVQLYLINKKDYEKNYTVKSHLATGTKSEIYDRLVAMDWVFWYLLKKE